MVAHLSGYEDWYMLLYSIAIDICNYSFHIPLQYMYLSAAII